MNREPEQQQLEESEVINQRFRELLRHKEADEEQQAGRAEFDEQERQVISQRFHQLCQQGRMDYEQFRRGLGLLGREDSFICRIFNLVDSDGDGLITEADYTGYLRVILRGGELEKARFGWLILTEGRGDIEFADFMELFQEISVVWNALTGEIVTPRRRYIEELFNTFDVDQDQVITFNDYRLFFDEHLQLFGWFEYFNALEVNEQSSRAEMQKLRERLRGKLRLQPQGQKAESPEELKLLLEDSERQLEKKLFQLTNGLREGSSYIRHKYRCIKEAQRAELEASKSLSELSSDKSAHTSNTADEELSLRSLYKYNYADSLRTTSINKIQSRKRKIKHESRQQLSLEVASELRGFLDSTCRLMELCQHYRAHAQRQRRFSPTKLKQMQAKLKLFDIDDSKRSRPQQPAQKMTVYFGHENWNLVLNIMVGLRQSIKALYELNSSLQLRDAHFQEQHSFFLGNKGFLSGKGPEALKNAEHFLFIEMAPIVFERLRLSYGLANNDYQRSVGPEYLLNQLLTGDLTALNEKCSTGKSGAFFYLTTDNRVFLKTIPKHEFLFFTRILRHYYDHMTTNPNSLVVRVYGLYKLKVYANKVKTHTIYFISMENIFSQLEGLQLLEVYDLKGSLYGRSGQDGKELKDQDWIERKKKISLPAELSALFREQIWADSRFFKKNNINDYSLMVAFVRYPVGEASKKEGNVFKSVRGGVASSEEGVLLVLSIIDFLTVFEARKNLEYIFKSTFLSKDVSCIPPSDYCHRFREFICSSLQ